MKNIKRLLCVCLIACICLCAVGCNKNTYTNLSGLSSYTTKNENSSVESSQEEKIINNLKEEIGRDFRAHKLNAPEVLSVIDFLYGYDEGELFLTSNGDLYTISMNKPFSNNSHCKKIESDVKFSKFSSGYILDKENNLYDYLNNSIQYATQMDEEHQIENKRQLLQERYCTSNNTDITWNYRITDSGIEILKYKYGINDDDKYDSILQNSETKIIPLPNDEKIVWYSDKTFKTEKSWYTFILKILNEEDVEKFADIEPQYSVEIKKLNLDSRIIFYKECNKSPIAIDNRGTVYTIY